MITHCILIKIEFEKNILEMAIDDKSKEYLYKENLKFIKTIENGKNIISLKMKSGIELLSHERVKIEKKYGIPIELVNKYCSEFIMESDTPGKLKYQK